MVGAARSGVALALHLTARGEQVRVVDRKPEAELLSTIAQVPSSVELRLGGYDDAVLEGVDIVYASPGVPWDSELLELCAVEGKVPKLGLGIEIEEAFTHCSKAFLRAQLWDPQRFVSRGELPSAGELLCSVW